MTLTRKQQATTEEWERALHDAKCQPGVDETAYGIVERYARAIQNRLPLMGQRVAYGWSGGKDSLVLELIMRFAGIDPCVLVISDLEYPAFLAWATDHMPHGLTVEARGWDIDWLSAHPEMLFPATANVASRWFAGVQHWGQRRYCKRREVDTLIMGRRRADGNYCGKGGADLYRDKEGFTRWSPLADMTNEEVITVLAGYDVDLPPCYFWPRGFRVGTGPWPARQWCEDTAAGWAEVASIDRSIVEEAARAIPSAYQYLNA